jgi:hypothetical protein
VFSQKANSLMPLLLNSRLFCNFAISHGPGPGTGNHPVEINTHGGNQDDGSRSIKPRIFASNGGFFA